MASLNDLRARARRKGLKIVKIQDPKYSYRIQDIKTKQGWGTKMYAKNLSEVSFLMSKTKAR